MPNPPRDRFDDITDVPGRVGAHRSAQRGGHGWTVFWWALLATVLLTAGGIFALMVGSGTIVFPQNDEPGVPATAESVIDTSYDVLILNATPDAGAPERMRQTVIEAGWAADAVVASDAAERDFPETTVYYSDEADAAAAQGLAGVVGAARAVLDDTYALIGDEGTSHLTVVIGLLGSEPTP